MTSHKTTTIVIVAVALASGACQRQSPNYCGDVSDHNCMDRPDAGTLSDAMAPSTDAVNMVKGCTSDSECPHGACDLPTNGPGTCVQCTASNSVACTNKTPACGIDHRCRICITNTECDTDACLPDGTCAEENAVAYVSQNGQGNSCTRNSPCGTLQSGLDTGLPYVRVSGSLSTDSPTAINRGVIILGDTGSGLTFTNDHDSAVKISLNNKSNDPIDVDNAQIVIINFRITDTKGDDNHRTDSIQILGMSPIAKLIHVSIDGGSGNGISTSDSSNSMATNPNIVLTDVAIRQKGMSGVHATGGQLTIIQSSIFSNSNISADINNITAGNMTAGIDAVESVKGFIDKSLISNNRHGNGITIQDGKFTINRSTILNNGNWGISCSRVTPGDVTISSDTTIMGNATPQTPQTNGC